VLGQLQQGQVVSKYSLQVGLPSKKGKLVIGPNEELILHILNWMHDNPTRSRSGREATLKRVQRLFYWKGITKLVKQYIRQCVICQSGKPDNSSYPGLLTAFANP